MTKLQWDQPGERFYEAGVDRGVLYLSDGSGIPWNGLVSIQETLDGDANEPLYFDGVRYYQHHVIGDYLATLQAFTYPDEFLEYEGVLDVDHGIFAGDQAPKMFGLSYRTGVGNDLDSGHYQLHIVYNLTAVPSDKAYSTVTNQQDPSLFAWQISAVPEAIAGYRPTAHVILDSRYARRFMLDAIEGVLYGSDEIEPSLPSLEDLTEFARSWQLIVIKDLGDGTWTATGPDELITMLNPTTFQITQVDAVYLDANTYEISSTA